MARGLDKENPPRKPPRRNPFKTPIREKGKRTGTPTSSLGQPNELEAGEETKPSAPQGIFTEDFYQEDPERLPIFYESQSPTFRNPEYSSFQGALEETAARLEFFWPGYRDLRVEVRDMGGAEIAGFGGYYNPGEKLIVINPDNALGEREEWVVHFGRIAMVHEAGHAIAHQILLNRGEEFTYAAHARLLAEYEISEEDVFHISVYARKNPIESMAELYAYMFAGGSRQMPDYLRLKFARLLRDNLPEHKLLPYDLELLAKYDS